MINIIRFVETDSFCMRIKGSKKELDALTSLFANRTLSRHRQEDTMLDIDISRSVLVLQNAPYTRKQYLCMSLFESNISPILDPYIIAGKNHTGKLFKLFFVGESS